MTNLVIGLGEIGSSVLDVVSTYNETYGYDIKLDNKLPTNLKVGVLHICFPPSDSFVDDVKRYIKEYNPKHVIVWSSTPIGTCAKIGKKVVHSPVEGKHPRLVDSIYLMVRWIGCADKKETRWFKKYFHNMNISSFIVYKPEYTEALKLLSTSEYGLNIVFADYKKSIADKLGMDYELMKQWNIDYNVLYKSLGYSQYQKFVLDPPQGKIGGHCVTQNAEILDKLHPNDILKLITEMKI